MNNINGKNIFDDVKNELDFSVDLVEKDTALEAASDKISAFNRSLDNFALMLESDNGISSIRKLEDAFNKVLKAKNEIPKDYLDIVDLSTYENLSERFYALKKLADNMKASSDSVKESLLSDHEFLTSVFGREDKFFSKQELDAFSKRNDEHKKFYEYGVWGVDSSLSEKISENAKYIAEYIAPYKNSYSGYGNIVMFDGSTYSGELKNGKPDGKGVMKYHNGAQQYDGEWKNGKRHGIGVLKDEKEIIHDGEWKNDIYDESSHYNIYNKATQVMDRALDLFVENKDHSSTVAYREAKALFEKIKGYKDADEKIRVCDAHISEYESKVAKANAIKKIGSCICFFAFFLLCPVICFLNSWYAMAYSFFLAVLAKNNITSFSRGFKKFMMVLKQFCFCGALIGWVAINKPFSFGDFVTILFSLLLFELTIRKRYSLNTPIDALDALSLFVFVIIYGQVIAYVLPISIWHVLWVSPLLFIALTVLRRLVTAKNIDSDVNMGLSFYSVLFLFSYAAKIIGAFSFNFGMFFFIVLVFVIHVLNWFIMSFASSDN